MTRTDAVDAPPVAHLRRAEARASLLSLSSAALPRALSPPPPPPGDWPRRARDRVTLATRRGRHAQLLDEACSSRLVSRGRHTHTSLSRSGLVREASRRGCAVTAVRDARASAVLGGPARLQLVPKQRCSRCLGAWDAGGAELDSARQTHAHLVQQLAVVRLFFPAFSEAFLLSLF